MKIYFGVSQWTIKKYRKSSTKILVPLLFYCVYILSSCNTTSLLDGTYRATVFSNSQLSWVHYEELEITGSELHFRAISVADSKILNEFKTSCTQFQDRLEFKDKNGLIMIARVDENGNLKYGDYTYKKIVSENLQPEEKETTKTSSDKNLEKELPLLVNNEDSLSIGFFIDEEGNHQEQYYLYLLNDKSYLITTKENDQDQKIFSGKKDKYGRLLDSYNKVSDYKIVVDTLFIRKDGNWIKFINQSCGM